MKNIYKTLLALLCLSTTTHAEDWMQYLPDEAYVANLSIPGAHDAATGHDVGMASFSQTQDLKFGDQWSLGVRAFDLRPIIKDDYLNINHGIAATNLRFDDALYQLRDSLIEHPTEFAVLHILYANGYEDAKENYKTMLLELVGRDDLKDYFVDFKPDLTVGEMRGKILMISRDTYDTRPIGGFFRNWCGYIDWNAQTNVKISGSTGVLATCHVQDLAETHKDGELDKKMEAIKTMLNYSTKHYATLPGSIVWSFNFASAYSKTGIFGISSSDGYRDNAVHTHATILDYLADENNTAGPTGIILADFVGVDEGTGFDKNTYQTRGAELVKAIIENNWRYITKETEEVKAVKAHYNTLLTLLSQLKDLRGDIKAQIAEECPDVAADFNTDLNNVLKTITNKTRELNTLYRNNELTLEYDIEEEAIMNELNRILLAAQEAQKNFEEADGIHTATASKDTGYTLYAITGERLDSPRRGAIHIVKYHNGTVKKVKF